MKKEVKIGIFAFIMLILLFWGINFLKGKNLFTRSHTFYTTFRDVDGLNVSGDVMFRGMKVGTITDIVFNPHNPGTIVVEFTIPKKYPVPNDSHISTVNPYIIGGKMMVIEYGHSAVMYQSGDTIPSINKPPMLGQITDQFGAIKDAAADLENNLSRTLDNINNLLSEENLKNLSGAISGVNHLINTDLRATMADLRSVSRNLNENSGNIDRILTNVGDFSDSLKAVSLPQLVDNINQTVNGLNEIVTKVNDGDGNLAQLINDREFYEELKASSANLAELLEDIKAHPGRYVSISVFGRKNR